MHPAPMSRDSKSRAQAPDRLEQDDLSRAWIEVVAALEEASTTLLHEAASGFAARGRSVAVVGAAWGGLALCMVVAWTCAHVALGLWLGSRHGGVVAMVVIAAIHGGAAPLLFTLIRLREMAARSPPPPSPPRDLP